MFPDVASTGLPLSGLKVIDITAWQQGTYATAMLADFGADVVKVEGPDSPDGGRGFSTGAGPGQPSGYFESHNRNKRGIVVDLKSPEGREVLLRLAEQADVFVQNMRQGVMERLGLGYDGVRERSPQIIYASASGYGQKGPHRQWPAMDILGQARGGTMMMMGEPDQAPHSAPGGLADHIGAMTLSYGILLALWHRARTGEGQHVDASLLGGQVMLQSFNITNVLITGKVPTRRFRKEADPLWNIYEARDGRYLAVSMLQSDRWWPTFCKSIGRPDIETDPRFNSHENRLANRTALIAKLDEVFATRDQMDWVTYLCECGLPAAPVQDYGQVIEDPQVAANDYIVDFDHPRYGPMKMVGPGVQLGKTPGSIRRPAPEFGQHTEEVLLEFGFSWDELSALQAVGAIGVR
ncbi:MAG: CaiB/BaiF CoA transferase family protein [Porticoccaceae bacterium]